MTKVSKLVDKLLNGAATLSEHVSDNAPIDQCWAWTYKPPMPASMQQEFDQKKSMEAKETL